MGVVVFVGVGGMVVGVGVLVGVGGKPVDVGVGGIEVGVGEPPAGTYAMCNNAAVCAPDS